MQNEFCIDTTENQLAASAAQEMLYRIFSVAELVAKSEERQVTSSTRLHKSCEKHRNENLVYCVDESINHKRTG